MKISINKKVYPKIVTLLLIFVLFFITTHKEIETKHINRVNNLSETNIINERQVSAKQLFYEAWVNIKNNYYNPNLNKQNWAKWKKRYLNKIKTQEDAYVAINSMIA